MIKKVLFPAIIMIFSAGCDKTNSVREDRQAYKPLNFQNFNLGEAHNQSVLTALNNIKTQRESKNVSPQYFTQTEVYTEYAKQISTLNLSPLHIDNDAFYNKVIIFNHKLALAKYDLRNLQPNETGLSLQAYEFIKKFFDDLSGVRDLSAVQNIVRKNEARLSKLSGIDRDIAAGTLQVALSSAQLWMGNEPVVKLMRLRNKYTAGGNIQQKEAPWYEKMILGDASGSAGYFAIMGWSAAIGLEVPGVNAAILGGWAMSAGLTSVTALGGF
jgi:hypothetical protein